MKTAASRPPVTRFGVFELDPRAGELRKKGMKIRLQGQPLEILAILLQHPGEPITREELQKKLWPADTFVDFEQGLNNAMKRLRAALDDDAESPLQEVAKELKVDAILEGAVERLISSKHCRATAIASSDR